MNLPRDILFSIALHLEIPSLNNDLFWRLKKTTRFSSRYLIGTPSTCQVNRTGYDLQKEYTEICQQIEELTHQDLKINENRYLRMRVVELLSTWEYRYIYLPKTINKKLDFESLKNAVKYPFHLSMEP